MERRPTVFFPAQRTLTQWGRRARWWRLEGQGHDMRRVVGLLPWAPPPGHLFSVRGISDRSESSQACPHILTVGSDRNQSGVHIGTSRIEVNPVGLLSLVRLDGVRSEANLGRVNVNATTATHGNKLSDEPFK